MKTLFRRVRAAFSTTATIPTEFFTAAMLTVFGSVLLNPQWHTFDAAVSYRSLVDWGVPEAGFGALYALAGLATFFGSLYGSLRLRQHIAELAVLLWSFISALILYTNHETNGGYTYALCAIVAGICAIKLRIANDRTKR